MTAFTRAMRLYDQGRFRDALPLFHKALEEQPGDVEVMYRAMLTLVGMRRYEECATWLQQLVPHINPAQTEPWMMAGFYYNLAIAYEASGRWAEAERNHRSSIAFDPNSILSRICLGGNCYRQGKPEEGRRWHDEAMALPVTDDECRPARAFVMMMRGDYLNGFAEYESRWTFSQTLAQAHIPKGAKRWQGQPVKRLNVVAEQGLGDMLQMARYVPLLLERGIQPVILASGGLVRLLAESFPGVAVKSIGDKYLPEKYWVPVMSLPYVFKTTTDTIPPAVWAKAQPSLPRSAQFRVGWCSRGNILHMGDHDRSCRTEAFATLLSTPGVEWVHLDEDALKYERNVKDFADTAGIIASCDLIVSIDSAVAHMAGSLGVPCWLVPPASPEWRWGEPTTELVARDTRWYPATHTLFRRRHVGEWTGVMARVRHALNALTTSPAIQQELQRRVA